MTDAEIRIAIAESVGWQWWVFHDSNTEAFYVIVPGDSDWPVRQNGTKCERPSPISERLTNDVPHYTEDLNAMHEVEKTRAALPL